MHRAELWTSQPDVGDAGELQQALHRAVLAELAVQDGQHHVQADRLVPSLLQDEQPVHASVRRQHGRTAAAVLPVRVRAVAELPGAARRDPDVERLVLLEVEVSCDLLRGLDGDRDAPRSSRRR